jgi:SAM-dependent methyltransferase
MKLIGKSRRLVKYTVTALRRAADFRSARRDLLTSHVLADKEKVLLEKVSLRVHRKDSMYVPFSAHQYLSAGLSAIHCIENSLDKSNVDNSMRFILDLPCGYGRVLRFLKARFPNAEITISDINTAALDFCKRVFAVRGVESSVDFSNLSLSAKFDLIWCGSLITHIDERAATELLRFFYAHVSPGGLCVFTTHGQCSVDWMEKGTRTYGLTEYAQQELLSQFYEKGYGYADYKNRHGIGISVVSHERMLAIARSVAPWNETSYLERGWEDFQDVYGFTK